MNGFNDKGYHAENLQTLASFLAYAEVDGVEFDMEKFSEGAYGPGAAFAHEYQCDSAGCAMGHATFIWPKQFKETYLQFGKRIFGMHRNIVRWSWCFDASWSDIDNTRLGAARRIQYLLDNDGVLTKDWDYDEETVALYASTAVKREHDLNVSELPVAERPRGSNAVIRELMERIEREPKFMAEKLEDV